jgi:hypothetical protein
MAQALECLASKYNALSLNPCTVKGGKKELESEASSTFTASV